MKPLSKNHISMMSMIRAKNNRIISRLWSLKCPFIFTIAHGDQNMFKITLLCVWYKLYNQLISTSDTKRLVLFRIDHYWEDALPSGDLQNTNIVLQYFTKIPPEMNQRSFQENRKCRRGRKWRSFGKRFFTNNTTITSFIKIQFLTCGQNDKTNIQ